MRHPLRPPQEEPQANEQEDTRGLWWYAAVVAAGFLAYVATLLVIVTKADAHDALPTAAQPEGWTYPSKCCSGLDCRRVGSSTTKDAKVRVFETPEGYRISTTDELIKTGDTRIYDSPDNEFHWCSSGGRDDGKTLCLYVPVKSG